MSRDPRAQATLESLHPYIDKARQFSGWFFPDIHEIDLDPGPTWDYAGLVRMYGAAASSVLDMGTGGGEFLASIRTSLPPSVVATEEWEVNAPVAYNRLAPLGAHVVRAKSLQLPFRDSVFDLEINRHEELDPAEVARVLLSGGTVITQQIGWNNWKELRTYLPYMTDFGDLFHNYIDGFRRAGLVVTQTAEHDHRIAYANLGELVYMILISPWSFPGFDPARDLNALLAVERDLACSQGICLTASHFLIVAHKPP